jgi:hypothetical protein
MLSVSIIHLPKLGTLVRLIRGGEAFKETNFKHVFLFLIYDVYVTTVSSLIYITTVSLLTLRLPN